MKMSFRALASVSICLCVLPFALGATPAVVDLGYSVYEGTSQSNGQNQFLGIRFAAPPLGDLRFRAPTPPHPTTGIQPANAFGPVCFGLGSGVTSGFSEDCLFLNVWAPSDATPQSRFPVFFWITGGGYIGLSNVNYNGSELVAATGNKMIFINFNYRVGPFGFLASEKVRADGDLNVGLLDQRLALEWIQKHIHAFGGDPERVGLVGASAGAGSVATNLVAFGGAPTKLFSSAFGLSPFFPTQLRISELEWQFDLFALRAGCDGVNDTLACLRAQNSSTLQKANVGMAYPGRTKNSLFPFTPAIDGSFLTDLPYRLFEQGRFVKVPSVFGDDTNEGTLFAANASSPEEVASFFKDNFPQLSDEDTNAINELYPLQIPNPFNKHAPFFPSAAAAYGESTFVCPGLIMSAAISKFTNSWNYRFNVLTPPEIQAGVGVSHTSEIPNLFGPGNAPAGSSTDGFNFSDISLTPILQAYYTSLIRSLNPNAHPVNGSVFWPQFVPSSNKRLLLQVNATTVETAPQDQLGRCAFWQKLGNRIEQ